MKFRTWLVAAFIAPFFVMSVAVSLARYFDFGSTWWGWAFAALSVMAGLCFIWQLPTSKENRALVTIVFVPICMILLAFYTPIFVSVFFGYKSVHISN
jgi:hypothetical protein